MMDQQATAATHPWRILVTVLAALTAWLLVDWQRAPQQAAFFPTAMIDAGWPLATLLLLTILPLLLTAGAVRRLSIAQALLLALQSAVLLMLALWLADQFLGEALAGAARWLLLVLATGWLTVRTLTLAGGGRWLLLLLASLGLFWLLFSGWARLGLMPTLWIDASYLDYEPEETTDPSLWSDLEPILFAQPSRIDVALSQLDDTQPQPKAYFLGFAGYGEEKVFAEEVRFAAAISAARFGTLDRSLLLINDQRDLASRPLASPSALTYALRELGKRMKTDEDLLVMMLSSHGSAEPALAVSNGLVPVRDLEAPVLRRALDRAGIRWRLLIISACYAGAFVEELATPETIIIAAAAPDRTSFGCSNDRDLTYFGEAFLRDSMLYLPTLQQAFEQARVLVTAREKDLGEEPSNPVAFFGEEIAARMDSWLRPPCEPATPDQQQSRGCPSKSPAP